MCQNGTRVPVIIPKECVPAMAYLANPVIRRDSGIRENNPYLFANTGTECKNINNVEQGSHMH